MTTYAPKRLAQFVAPSLETTYYTVPVSTFTIVKNVVFANSYPSSVSVSLSVVPTGQIAGFENRIVPGISIPGNSTVSLDLSTVMAAGDFLSASATVGSAVATTISGVEASGNGLAAGGTPAPSVSGILAVTSGTRPSSPTNGQTIYETDTDRLMTYDGATWEPMSVPITTSGARPSSIAGQYIHETDTGLLKSYNGSNWVTVTNFKVLNVGSALTGSPPAIDTGSIPFKIQTGTSVLTSAADGFFDLTFPTAFPNGLVTVMACPGSTGAGDWRVLVSDGGYGTSGFRIRTFPGAILVRVNWMAIGW